MEDGEKGNGPEVELKAKPTASSANAPKARAANGSAELGCRNSVLAGSKNRSANKRPDWRSIRVASSVVTTLIESKKKV